MDACTRLSGPENHLETWTKAIEDTVSAKQGAGVLRNQMHDIGCLEEETVRKWFPANPFDPLGCLDRCKVIERVKNSHLRWMFIIQAILLERLNNGGKQMTCFCTRLVNWLHWSCSASDSASEKLRMKLFANTRTYFLGPDGGSPYIPATRCTRRCCCAASALSSHPSIRIAFF